MRPLTAGGLVAATTLLVLTGCGSSNSGSSGGPSPGMSMAPGQTMSGTTPSGAATGAATSVITIKSFAYAGATSVKAGSTVTVKNDDAVSHTVTADDKGFDVIVQANSTKTFTAPNKPGSYPYHCTYHSNMHGTLKVT